MCKFLKRLFGGRRKFDKRLSHQVDYATKQSESDSRTRRELGTRLLKKLEQEIPNG